MEERGEWVSLTDPEPVSVHDQPLLPLVDQNPGDDGRPRQDLHSPPSV
jgi:hypothetical protein